MSREPVTVGMDDDLHRVKDLFELYRFHHLLASSVAVTWSGESLPRIAFCSRVAGESMRAYAGSPYCSVSPR